MSTSNSDEQKALAAGAAALIAAYDLANTNDSLGAVYGTPTQMAKTMALMALAKKNHKDCPFWYDRQGEFRQNVCDSTTALLQEYELTLSYRSYAVFMTRIIPLFKTYPVYDQNMQASVSADARLHSEAGVFRFDYEKVSHKFESRLEVLLITGQGF